MRLSRSLILFAALAASLPVLAHATVYNAVSGFSVTNGNPNGVWSYGYGTPGSTPTLYTVSGTSYSGAAWDYWAISAGNGLPVVAHSPAGGGFSTAQPTSSVLDMHPGNADNAASMVIFTAPAVGSYSFAGYFQREDTTNQGGTGATADIYDNGTLLFSQGVPTTSYLDEVTFSNSATLNAGDTLTFVVARTGDYSFDSTGLNLTITSRPLISAIPEPSTLLLFGTGTLGVVGALRRRFSRA